MSKPVKQNSKLVDMVMIDEPVHMDRFGIDQDYITELASSIEAMGLLQPIVIRPVKGRFEVIAGHCRFLAHKRLGRLQIQSIIIPMDDPTAALARATENISRTNLTPMEEAAVYNNLIEKLGLTVEKVGQKMGKSPGTVKRRLDLLRMPPILQDAVHKKEIAITVAEELWPIADLTMLQYYLTFAIESGCTKETARIWCKEWKDAKRRDTPHAGGGDFIASPYEPRPTYMPCDMCHAPVELGKETTLRICPGCETIIKDNM